MRLTHQLFRSYFIYPCISAQKLKSLWLQALLFYKNTKEKNQDYQDQVQLKNEKKKIAHHFLLHPSQSLASQIVFSFWC